MKHMILAVSLFFTGILANMYMKRFNTAVERRIYRARPLTSRRLIRISNICLALSTRFLHQQKRFDAQTKPIIHQN